MSSHAEALPLVLLPGTLCDQRVFAPLLSALRGLRTPPFAATVEVTAQCSTIHAAAEHVLACAPPQFALLGFSLGGIVALETALLARERVLGLALLNVNAAPAPAHMHGARRAAVDCAHTMGLGRFVRAELWKSYVAPASLADEDLQCSIVAMAEDLGGVAFHNQTEAALTRRDYWPVLASLTMPTLVQAGAHDAVCPAVTQQELASALPNAEFSLIADAGHFALLERRDAVATSVAAWLHNVARASAALDPQQEKL